MRVGVAGVGRIGSMHAALLARHPAVDTVVVCDPLPGRAAEFTGRFGGEAVESVEAFLTIDLDAVVIATSTASHADLVEHFCRAGVPTFCEKPVAMDVARTRDVARVQAATGTMVHVGFQRRFDPGYVELRRRVLDSELGGIRRMHLVSADPAPPPAAFITTSGGIFRDLLIHDFDLLRWVSGHEVSEVFATGTNRGDAYFGDAGDVDEAVVVVTLDDGTLATVHGSRYNGAGYDVRMEVAGTAGTSMAGLDDRLPVRSSEPGVSLLPGPAWAVFSDRFAAAYAAELSAFLRLAAEGGPSACTVDDGHRALLIAEAADLSVRAGRTVTMSEILARDAAL